MKVMQFTQQGYATLMQEEAALQSQRKQTVQDLQKAREMGDLSENGFYKATKMRLGDLDRKIREVSYMKKTAKIIEKNEKTDVIHVGSSILLETNGEKVTYRIVGSYEADSLKGDISNISPLGKLLIGKTIGDVVEVQVKVPRVYKILQVS